MRETLKLALEAFEAIPEEIEGWIPDKCTDAVIAIKEALAQPEQSTTCGEPVAWITEKISGPTKGYMTVTFNKDTGWKDARSIPLYEHPPQRKPLTDEQIDALAKKHFAEGERSFKSCARAIEAAHGIKE